MQNGRHERAQEQNNFFFLRRFQHDESVRVVFFLAFVFNYSMAMAVGGCCCCYYFIVMGDPEWWYS